MGTSNVRKSISEGLKAESSVSKKTEAAGPRTLIAMPSYPCLKSLQESCLLNIVRHMDTTWCKDFLAHQSQLNKIQCRFVLGPFDDLPPKLVHEIWMKMLETRTLKKHHVYLLLSPFFVNLSLKGLHD